MSSTLQGVLVMAGFIWVVGGIFIMFEGEPWHVIIFWPIVGLRRALTGKDQ